MRPLVRRIIGLLTRRPALLTFVAAATFGFSIDTDLSLTDDARFYVPAAETYGEWMVEALVGVVTLDATPLHRERLDAVFGQNHEHPPVGKYVMALTWLLFHRFTSLLDDVAACRVGVTLLWAMMVTLVFSLVRRVRGSPAGASAALALALMPRLLFDAHAETLDLPIAAFMTLAAALVFNHLERPSFLNSLGAIVAFALALGTKHNAPFFLVALFVYWLLVNRPTVRGVELRFAPLPLIGPGLVVVSPLLVLAIWPWLCSAWAWPG